jgi:hypothetical protein
VSTDTGSLPVDDGAGPTETRSPKAVADPPSLLTDQVIVDTRSMKFGLDRPRTILGTVSPDAVEKTVGTGPTTAGDGAMSAGTGTLRPEPDALRVGTSPSSVETGAMTAGADPILVVPAPAAHDARAGSALLDAMSVVPGSGPTERGRASTFLGRAPT